MESPGTPLRRQLTVGASLFALALVWTVIVYVTVPTGSGVGPRAFPLVLGIVLMALSAILMAADLIAWRRHVEQPAAPGGAAGGGDAARAPGLLQLRVLVTVCIAIAVYGYLMQKVGFVMSTFLTVVGLLLILKERRVLILAGMGLGITLGSWLVFGEVLGAYIPRGTWISLF